MLKFFLLLLDVTCVIFARTTNTDVLQAIVARATKSWKNSSTFAIYRIFCATPHVVTCFKGLNVSL